MFNRLTKRRKNIYPNLKITDHTDCSRWSCTPLCAATSVRPEQAATIQRIYIVNISKILKMQIPYLLSMWSTWAEFGLTILVFTNTSLLIFCSRHYCLCQPDLYPLDVSYLVSLYFPSELLYQIHPLFTCLISCIRFTLCSLVWGSTCLNCYVRSHSIACFRDFYWSTLFPDHNAGCTMSLLTGRYTYLLLPRWLLSWPIYVKIQEMSSRHIQFI